MTKVHFSSLLPAVNQTDALTKFFGATVDQVFQPGTSETVHGYIGQIPAYNNPETDFYLAEPTAARQVYQLEPGMVSFDSTGTLAQALTYADMVSYLHTSGGVATNHQRLFETEYYTWAPPVDIDKLVNFDRYYWFGDAAGAASLPVLAVSAPIETYIGDGTTASFSLPDPVAGISSAQETPAAYVNGTLVASTLSANSLVLTSPPTNGDTVTTTRYNDLSVAITDAVLFPLFGMVNNLISFAGDGVTTAFSTNIINPSLAGNLTKTVVFVNDTLVSFVSMVTGAANPAVVTSGQAIILNGQIITFASGLLPDVVTTINSATHATSVAASIVNGALVLTASNTLITLANVGTGTALTALGLVSGVSTSITLPTPPKAATLASTADQVTIATFTGVSALLSGTVTTVPTGLAVAAVPALSSGMRIRLVDMKHTADNTLPDTYFVDGVGDGIRLTSDNTIIRGVAAQYVTIDRSSLDGNLWSLHNSWVHGDTFAWSGQMFNSRVAVRPIIEFMRDMVLWSPQTWSESVDPLFMLYDVNGIPFDDAAQYPSSTFSGNRIFGFAAGSGGTDSVLLRPLQYDKNGYIVFSTDATLFQTTYVGGTITSLPCFGVNSGSLTSHSLWWPANDVTAQTTQAGGYLTIPPNLQANPLSDDVGLISRSDWINHFAEILTSQTVFSGSYAQNNFRDSARDLSVGAEILQHRAPLLKAMLLASDKRFDYFAAVRFADQEYNRFRNKFARKILDLHTRGLISDTAAASVWVQAALDAMVQDKTTSFPFADSAMAGGSYFIPPTPAFMGLLPCVTPGLTTDNTFDHPVPMIRGHDGSLTPAFQDWRDAIMLALETLIYDNIQSIFKTEARPNFDIAQWMNGRFFSTTNGFSLGEINSMLRPIFERWAQSGRFDFQTNKSYDEANPFTWNYRGVPDRAGNLLPGNWRAIYRWYYDTDRPDVAPWEMLGFAEQPSWWTVVYGTVWGSSNTQLWSDLEAGMIRQGARALTGPTVDPRYARPGLIHYIPVNSSGLLLDPVAAGIVPVPPSYRLATRPWQVGDGSPAENLWWNSPSYRFALAQIAFLMKPARLTEILWDSVNYTYKGNQWVDRRTLQRPDASAAYVHGEIDPTTGTSAVVIGIQQWISDYIIMTGQSPSSLGIAVRNLDTRLVHPMAGFVTSDEFEALSDTFGLVPTEDVQVSLYRGPARATVSYSGVIVEWTGSGYRVVGYDSRDSYFNIIPPDVNSPKGVISLSTTADPVIANWHPNVYYAVGVFVSYQGYVYKCLKSHTSGNFFETNYWELSSTITTPSLRVVTYMLGLVNIEQRIPYGTEFSTIQQVADFLLSYERWLVAQGFVFDSTDPGTQKTRNWSLAVYEFLGWSQVQWAAGNFIALSPGAEMLKFSTPTGTVLNVEDSNTGFYGLLDRSGQPIGAKTARISRIDDIITLSAVGADIFGARLLIADVEHLIVFSNTTIFNDIVYLPLFNMRQTRLKLMGNMSSNWDGRLDAPGYVMVGSRLVPSFDKNVEDIRLMFEIEKTDRTEYQKYARHLIGFQTRDYMQTLLLSEIEQIEFYQGMIQTKGSPGVFSRLMRSLRIDDNSNTSFLEEWAIRVSIFGAPRNPRATFSLPHGAVHRDPQIIRFVATSNAPEDWMIVPFGAAAWIDTPSVTNFFPPRPVTAPLALPSAGPVRLTDVQYTSFSTSNLSAFFATHYSINGTPPFLAGERVWLYDVDGTWDVWRVFETAATPNTINNVVTPQQDATVTGIRLYFDLPTTITSQDVGATVVIDNSTYSTPDLMGISTILTVNTASNWIEIDAVASAGFSFAASSNSKPHLRIFRSVRFATNSALAASANPWSMNDLVWINNDNSTPGAWAVYAYTGSTWSLERNQPARIDPTSIENSVLFSAGSQIVTNNGDNQLITNDPLIGDLVVVDPLAGELPGVAMREIDFRLDFDPALYTAGAAGAARNPWGSNEVGRVWWNLATVRYLDPYTDLVGASDARDIAELTYRARFWAQVAPDTNVDVYEWVASDISPTTWASMAAGDTTGKYTGTVYQNDNPSWVEETFYDASRGAHTTVYYFWVKGRDTVPDVPFRKTAVSTVANILTNPTSEGLAWIAPIAPDSLLVSGVAPLLNDTTSALKIELVNASPDSNHDEWMLLRENDSRSVPPDWLWRKLRDSLACFDVQLNLLPDPSLSPSRNTGILPGQSMFSQSNQDGPRGGLLAARRNFIGMVNSILSGKPVMNDNLKGAQALILQDSLPYHQYWSRGVGYDSVVPVSSFYDVVVYNITERNALVTSHRLLSAIGTGTSIRVLVDGTKTQTPFWSIWNFNPAAATTLLAAAPSTDPMDYLLQNADSTFTLASNYDYIVSSHANRDALLTTDYYAQNIVINGSARTFSSTDIPTASFTSTQQRDLSEGSPPRDTLVAISNGATWFWTQYDLVYGWITVAASQSCLTTGTRVYVQSDETADFFWTVYTYDPANPLADSKGFVLNLKQKYRTKDFLSGTPNAQGIPVVDWYAQNVTVSGQTVSYDASNPPMVSYPDERARNITEGPLPTNQFVQIRNSSNNWYWTAWDSDAGWQVVARQGATIALSGKFYDSSRVQIINDVTNLSAIANRDGSWELRVMIDAMRDGGLLSASDLNTILFGLVYFIHSQQDDVDWVFKTSFMSIAGYAEPLTQTAIQTKSLSDSITAYVNEVKPYHVKIRDYSQQYSAGVEVANTHATDFDAPTYYDSTTGQYRTLDPTNASDMSIIQTQQPWKDWYENYLLNPSAVRKFKISMLFDRVTGDLYDGYDWLPFDTDAFDAQAENGIGTAIDRITNYYTPIDPVTGGDLNAILTYSFGAADLLNTRFKGAILDGSTMASPSPSSIIDGSTMASPVVTNAINAATSVADRAVSDTVTVSLPNGQTATVPLGGVADPLGFGLIDPYLAANRPEERAQISADDGLVMTITTGATPGAPHQRVKSFDTSSITSSSSTFFFEEIPESAESVLVWRDGVRAILNTDYTVDHLGRSLTVNLLVGGNQVKEVVVHAFGTGGTSPIIERHLLVAPANMTTYTLDAAAITSQVEIIVNGARLASGGFSLSGNVLTFAASPTQGDDVVILVYENGVSAACLAHSETLAYVSNQTWSLVYPDTQTLPEHAGIIVELNGKRLTPPPTYYGFFDLAHRSIYTDYVPTSSTTLVAYVDGVLYPYQIPLVTSGNSGYPFGATPLAGQTIVQNTSGMLAFLDNLLVSLDPTFDANDVRVSIVMDNDYTVSNGTLVLVTAMATTDTLVATTFSNASVMDIRTYTYANSSGNYASSMPLAADYSWVSVDGLLLRPDIDYAFVESSASSSYLKTKAMDNTGTTPTTSKLVATVFCGSPGQDASVVRRATATSSAARMDFIPDNGGFDFEPFDCQRYDEGNGWLGGIPRYGFTMPAPDNYLSLPLVRNMTGKWEQVVELPEFTGILAADLVPSDTTATITLAQADLNPKLWSQTPLPLPTANRPGVVWVGGERIEYFSLSRTGNTVVLGTMRRGTNGTSISLENRTVARYVGDGVNAVFAVAAAGGVVEVTINGVAMAEYNPANAHTMNAGYNATSSGGTTTVTFLTAPAAGSFVTVAMSNGARHPAGTIVLNGEQPPLMPYPGESSTPIPDFVGATEIL